MEKEQIEEVIEKLLEEMEEEDVTISLFTIQYQDSNELEFFSEPDREQVRKILTSLARDGKRHKEVLERIIEVLEAECHEKRLS